MQLKDGYHQEGKILLFLTTESEKWKDLNLRYHRHTYLDNMCEK